MGTTQAERDAARARTPSGWDRVDEAGRAREASEAARRQQAAERESYGPSLGMVEAEAGARRQSRGISMVV